MPDSADTDLRAQLGCVADASTSVVFRLLLLQRTTISQLGASLGKHPAWVRHHVLKLLASGLVELVESRTTRNYTEKYYEATPAAHALAAILETQQFFADPDSPLVAGSHDLALELLATGSRHGHVRLVSTGSLNGLIALRQGLADVAACHLFDAHEDEFNTPWVRHLFPDLQVRVVTLVHREQGLITATGNPMGLRGIEDVLGDEVTVVTRNAGSGTRLWLDGAVTALGADPASLGHLEARTHTEAASLVASGVADAGIGIRAAAEAAGLGFVPLFSERFDLVIRTDRASGALDELVDEVSRPPFRRAVTQLAGYDVGETGCVRTVHA